MVVSDGVWLVLAVTALKAHLLLMILENFKIIYVEGHGFGRFMFILSD